MHFVPQYWQRVEIEYLDGVALFLRCGSFKNVSKLRLTNPMYALCTSILAEVQSLSGPISPYIKLHLCDLKCTDVTLMYSKSGFLLKGFLLKFYFWVRSFKLYIFSVCHSHVVGF